MTGGGFLGGSRRLTRARLAAVLTGCAALAAALVAFIPLIGVDLSGDLELLAPGEVWAGITGPDNFASRVVLQSRLPRVLAAMIIGAGLAGAGCAFQAVLRNPLAEPYTLGISSGASLAAVLAIRFGWGGTVVGISGTGLAALGGAAVTIYLVWRLARVGRSLPPATLLLAGITIAMFCSAATMMVQYTADFTDVSRIVHWMMGGLTWVEYGSLARAAVAIGLGLIVLLWLARDLNALAAGSEAAASVGVDPMRASTLTFVVASLIVGAGIAIAGPIGFVGLIVPHALRALIGPDHRALLPASMLVGGSFLAVCDTTARMVLGADEIPVGIVTALLGGPFFLYLLLREKRSGRIWGG